MTEWLGRPDLRLENISTSLSSEAGSTLSVRLSRSGSMRLVAIQAFRTARRVPVWKAPGPFSSSQTLGFRSFSGGKHTSFIPASLQSPMHLRNFSLAVISTVVASGAWYAYQGGNLKQIPLSALNSTSQITSVPTGGSFSVYAEDPVETSYRALLVDNDQLSTATVSGEPTIYKHSDDSDRRALEMLTPEQATQKLRKNEESYLVNRGKGVVRYDVVQVPSNWPIEDDHAEKIVEVPSSVAPAKAGEGNSDWMFWAVFDGHS